MNRVTVKIEKMTCGMCEAHICDTIRKAIPSAKKVKASRAKGEAAFLTQESFDNETLERAIAETGYTCLSISRETCKRKGFFSLFRRA